ncbi:MAG: hypothetical protein MUF11_06770 [Beijerinckiaceae bacterium]|jgi:hypothetical protein|nr:hypothetical protein [Beijerinckiaceae bacterium]
MIEAFLGDVILAILQQPVVRWSLALGIAFWVWMVSDEDAQLRKLYLAGPFLLAGVIEIADSLFFGRNSGGGTSGWLAIYLQAMEGVRLFVGLLGLVALLLAAFTGFKRGLGFCFGLAVLLAAYLADQMGGGRGSFFSLTVLGNTLLMLPPVLALLLVAYGLGATLRSARELRSFRSRYARDE